MGSELINLYLPLALLVSFVPLIHLLLLKRINKMPKRKEQLSHIGLLAISLVLVPGVVITTIAREKAVILNDYAGYKEASAQVTASCESGLQAISSFQPKAVVGLMFKEALYEGLYAKQCQTLKDLQNARMGLIEEVRALLNVRWYLQPFLHEYRYLDELRAH